MAACLQSKLPDHGQKHQTPFSSLVDDGSNLCILNSFLIVLAGSESKISTTPSEQDIGDSDPQITDTSLTLWY